MIKIYTDLSYFKKEFSSNFFPLLNEIFDQNPLILNKFQITSVCTAADVFILPLKFEFYQLNKTTHYVHEFKKLAQLHQKQLWIFTPGDVGYSFSETYIRVFRMAVINAKKSTNDVIMPVFISDPTIKFYNSEVSFLPKTQKHWPIGGWLLMILPK